MTEIEMAIIAQLAEMNKWQKYMVGLLGALLAVHGLMLPRILGV